MKNRLLMIFSITFKFFLLTSLACGATAATYYVDSVNGTNDPRASPQLEPGSKEHPFKTIGRASSVARSGDRIALMPGTYSRASGELFPIHVSPGVTINPAQSSYISNGVMRTVISGKNPNGGNYAHAFEVWNKDVTVEKMQISDFSRPFHVEASGLLRLNVVAFFNNSNGAFQAINGGGVVINDITLGKGTGGFYVGTGSTVSGQTIYIQDKATSGITVEGTRSSLSIRDLNFKGSPNLTLLKIRDEGSATLTDAKISGTGSCASPCTESPAIKAYENSTLTLEGGEIKWNRPGFAVYFEIDTVGRYTYSVRSGSPTRIERTYKNDKSGKGLVSVGGTFGKWVIPRHETPQLEIKHPDGVGLELRHSKARASNFMDVAFSSGGGTSIFVGKGAHLAAYGLNFGSSKGTHVAFEEHYKSEAPFLTGSTFSESATRALEIRNCKSGSAQIDFGNNTWKKNTQGSNSQGRYPSKSKVTGAQIGGNYRMASHCSLNLGY